MRPNMFYVISDTHFNHANIVRSGVRPADYQERILTNLEKTLRPYDCLIHLGDVSWSAKIDERFIKLPCKKILVRGNHDKQSSFWYMRNGFDMVVNDFSIDQGDYKFFFTHQPIPESEMNIFSPGVFNVCGHLHNFEGSKKEFPWVYTNPSYYVVVLEENGYMPESLNSIAAKLKKRGVKL